VYITSNELKHNIRQAIQSIEYSVNGLVEFVEYIAKPDVGSNIILRFDYIGKYKMCIGMLNDLEVKMRQFTKDRYLVNMMGTVCRDCGLQLEKLNKTLISIDAVSEILIPICDYHKARLDEDIETVIRSFQLPPDTLIWEMQINKDDILILALSNDERNLSQFSKKELNIDGEKVKLCCLYNDGSFAGLMKATAIAYHQKVSICQVLLDYTAC
jgi:hypothetical protein